MYDRKPKPERYTSPVGVAFHPYLDKPDTKFKDAGEYKTNLRFSAEDAATLKARVDAAMAEARKNPELVATKKKNPKATVPENAPYKDVFDDNGDETGEVEFKFATTASGQSKKNGETWTRTIKFFDAKGQPMKPVSLWSGSRIRVSYTIGTYFINAKVGYGVKLYLEAVKVIEAVQGGGGSASDYGFGDEEEGYTKDDMQSDESVTEDTKDKDESDADTSDF